MAKATETAKDPVGEPQVEADDRPEIFKSLAAIKREINADGVAKARDNQQQGYKYRGIDDALNAFSGPLAREEVIITPVYDEGVFTDLPTRSGSNLIRCVVRGVFTFLSLKDGSTLTVGPFEGEASDTLDKSLSKATSVAMRNMLFLTFTVPFMGEVDPDAVEDPNAEQAAGATVKSPAGGERVFDLTVSQAKIVDIKLEAKGKNRDWLMDEFGAVTGKTINAALAFIEKHGDGK